MKQIVAIYILAIIAFAVGLMLPASRHAGQECVPPIGHVMEMGCRE